MKLIVSAFLALVVMLLCWLLHDFMYPTVDREEDDAAIFPFLFISFVFLSWLINSAWD